MAQAKKLSGLGLTDREIAHFFEIDERTLNRWKHDHPDFCLSLRVGKDVSDDRVEQALYRRAIGFEHDEVHISTYEGKVTKTPIVRTYPPDTAAVSLWLRNRRPGAWRDKREEDGADAAALALAIRELVKATDAVTDAAA